MFCLPYTFAPQITRNNNMSNSNKTNERNKPLTFPRSRFCFVPRHVL